MEGIIDTIKKLTPKSVLFGAFTYVSVISPGYMFFYLYHRDFFIACDWTKLLLLSIGITAPFLVINIFLAAISISAKTNKTGEAYIHTNKAFGLGAYLTVMIFYVPMFNSYWNFIAGVDDNPNFEAGNFKPAFFVVGICFEQVFLVIAILVRFFYFLRKHKKAAGRLSNSGEESDLS
jgi:hypothetical protein